MKLEAFAIRTISEVREQGAPAVIRLQERGEADALCTWSQPFPPVDEWQRQAEAFLADLAMDLPARRHTMVFSAVMSDGTVLEQCHTALLGRGSKTSSKDEGQRAVTQSMQAVASLVEQMTGAAATQIKQYQELHRQAMEQVQSTTRLLQAHQEQAIMVQEQQRATGDALAEAVKQQVPALLNLLVQRLPAKIG